MCTREPAVSLFRAIVRWGCLYPEVGQTVKKLNRTQDIDLDTMIIYYTKSHQILHIALNTEILISITWDLCNILHQT